MTGSVARAIEGKLIIAFAPVRLLVQDQSEAHRGHAGAVGRTETHFRVEVVSTAFEGLNRLARERRVQEVLAVELSDRVHALSVAARTPAEDNSSRPPSEPGTSVFGFREAQRAARKKKKDA